MEIRTGNWEIHCIAVNMTSDGINYHLYWLKLFLPIWVVLFTRKMNSAGTNDDLLPLMSSTSYQRSKLSVLFLLSVCSLTPAIVALLGHMRTIFIIMTFWPNDLLTYSRQDIGINVGFSCVELTLPWNYHSTSVIISDHETIIQL